MDFDLEGNYQVKNSQFKRGGRTHNILEMFDKPERHLLAMWSGKCEACPQMVAKAKAQIDTVTTSVKVDSSHDALMAETVAKTNQALAGARGKLAEGKEEAAKKRRVSSASSSCCDCKWD